ncbi:MAG: hypothetical protein CMC59_08525 [Flavobacteriaceae bacterium]|jgi:hypothetical protein|nr:hypothetical protein [Flavobacteriaceae bacterium]|tara:strand:+ start:349 stop:540 length:192 start_codon:yes stop_codon:yes gene_type:complete
MGKRFTFADAKAKIKELEDKIESLNLDTGDNIYSSSENKIIKLYKVWALLGPVFGFVVGLLFF